MKAIKIASGENAKLRLVTVTGGERTELECECELLGGDGRHIIKYKDGAGKVMMKLTSERAELLRTGGETGLKLSAEPNAETIAKIKTEYGTLSVPVRGISHNMNRRTRGSRRRFRMTTGTLLKFGFGSGRSETEYHDGLENIRAVFLCTFDIFRHVFSMGS